jgi:hypothetical protein
MPIITPPLKSGETDTTSREGFPGNAIPAAPGSERSLVHDPAETSPESPLPPPSRPPSAQPGNKIKLIAVTAIVVIIALVAGAFIYSTILGGNEVERPVIPVTPAITPEATMIPTPTVSPSPTPQITILPTPRPTLSVPDKGVWVKVQYTGNFTGRVGTAGNMKLVNASGDQYYQIPINDGIVEVLLQKEDGSGNMLVVEVYQNGKMVSRSTKATPYGAVEVRETIKRG